MLTQMAMMTTEGNLSVLCAAKIQACCACMLPALRMGRLPARLRGKEGRNIYRGRMVRGDSCLVASLSRRC